jgi:hypothetical protein
MSYRYVDSCGECTIQPSGAYGNTWRSRQQLQVVQLKLRRQVPRCASYSDVPEECFRRIELYSVLSTTDCNANERPDWHQQALSHTMSLTL